MYNLCVYATVFSFIFRNMSAGLLHYRVKVKETFNLTATITNISTSVQVRRMHTSIDIQNTMI